MNNLAESPQTVPAGAAQVAAGDTPIPEVSSGPGGAQTIQPAPAGTIPSPMKPFSERPDSAKSKMLERLRNQGKPKAAESTPEQKPAAKPAEQPATETEESPESTPETDEDLMGEIKGKKEEKKPETKPEQKQEQKPTEQQKPEEKGKPNPWRLVDEHKAARAALEKEVADLKKLVGNPETRKTEVEEIERLRTKNQELEKHMRFVDYQQSEEYQTKYEAPYKAQWKTSMKELKGVMVDTAEGQREISADDMFQLVNMPMVKAKQLASEIFGDFASDVMAHRNAIRDKFESREAALANAKTEGFEKHQAAVKQMTEEQSRISGELKSAYEAANDFVSKDKRHSEFLSEREGDDEGNEMLRKGYANVDSAFAQNPLAPGLTSEQRVSIVKKHAAVRHKAAAYGRLTRDLIAEREAHAATKAKLAEYEGTTPNRGSDSKPAVQPMQSGSKMSAMQQRLRARAKPVPA